MQTCKSIRTLVLGVGFIFMLPAVSPANVQIFFTPASEFNPWMSPGPANAFMPTAGNKTDWSGDGYVPNYAAFPTQFRAETEVSMHDVVYIWIKFNTDTQLGPVDGAKFEGLHLRCLAQPDDIVWYIMDDTNGVQGAKRWDGYYTPPNFPEFKRLDQVLMAVTGTGIRNTSTNQPIGLYNGATRVGLLGAIQVNTGEYPFELGSLGIWFNSAPHSPPVQFGHLFETPEPAGVLLIALVGVVIRRR